MNFNVKFTVKRKYVLDGKEKYQLLDLLRENP